MRITELRLTAFGPYRDQVITLEEGLNLLQDTAANNALIGDFVGGVCCGLYETVDGERRFGEDYHRYRPGEGEEYLGSIVVCDDARCYRICRDFNLLYGGCQVVDDATGELVEGFSPCQLMRDYQKQVEAFLAQIDFYQGLRIGGDEETRRLAEVYLRARSAEDEKSAALTRLFFDLQARQDEIRAGIDGEDGLAEQLATLEAALAQKEAAIVTIRQNHSRVQAFRRRLEELEEAAGISSLPDKYRRLEGEKEEARAALDRTASRIAELKARIAELREFEYIEEPVLSRLKVLQKNSNGLYERIELVKQDLPLKESERQALSQELARAAEPLAGLDREDFERDFYDYRLACEESAKRQAGQEYAELFNDGEPPAPGNNQSLGVVSQSPGSGFFAKLFGLGKATEETATGPQIHPEEERKAEIFAKYQLADEAAFTAFAEDLIAKFQAHDTVALQLERVTRQIADYQDELVQIEAAYKENQAEIEAELKCAEDDEMAAYTDVVMKQQELKVLAKEMELLSKELENGIIRYETLSEALQNTPLTDEEPAQDRPVVTYGEVQRLKVARRALEKEIGKLRGETIELLATVEDLVETKEAIAALGREIQAAEAEAAAYDVALDGVDALLEKYEGVADLVLDPELEKILAVLVDRTQASPRAESQAPDDELAGRFYRGLLSNLAALIIFDDRTPLVITGGLEGYHWQRKREILHLLAKFFSQRQILLATTVRDEKQIMDLDQLAYHELRPAAATV